MKGGVFRRRALLRRETLWKSVTTLFLPCPLLLLLVAQLAPAQELSAPLDPLDDARWIERLSTAPSASLAADSQATLEHTLHLLAALPASDSPERWLPRLAGLAATDDPDLAPAASRCALTIAEGMEASALDARESALPEGVVASFEALSADESARADIRAAAAWTAARLSEL